MKNEIKNLAQIIRDTFVGKNVYWSSNYNRQCGIVESIYNGKAVIMKPNGRRTTQKLIHLQLGFYPGMPLNQ